MPLNTFVAAVKTHVSSGSPSLNLRVAANGRCNVCMGTSWRREGSIEVDLVSKRNENTVDAPKKKTEI